MAIAFRMAAGILGWAALVLQYALVLTGTLGADSFTRSINFFSYFTILTNIVVALALTGTSPDPVTPELVAEIGRRADPPGAFRAWALAQPWPRFCAVVLVVSGEWTRRTLDGEE